MSVKDVLETSVAHLRKITHRVDDAAQALAAAPHRQSVIDSYASALDQAEHFDVWDIDARMSRTPGELGLAVKHECHRVPGLPCGGPYRSVDPVDHGVHVVEVRDVIVLELVIFYGVADVGRLERLYTWS